MPPRPDVSEERTRQIIQAAGRVFARLSFDRARMDDIGQEAGLSKGALYWYFKSKDDLIAALLDHFFARELDDLRELLAAEGAVSERLMVFNEKITAEFERIVGLLPITFEFYAVAARQKAVRQFLGDYFQQFLEVLSALIQQGVESGEFRPVDSGEVAITVTALYEELTLLNVVDSLAFDWRKQAEAGLRLALEGLKARA